MVKPNSKNTNLSEFTELRKCFILLGKRKRMISIVGVKRCNSAINATFRNDRKKDFFFCEREKKSSHFRQMK